jgi:hypothetical protein
MNKAVAKINRDTERCVTVIRKWQTQEKTILLGEISDPGRAVALVDALGSHGMGTEWTDAAVKKCMELGENAYSVEYGKDFRIMSQFSPNYGK